MHRTTSNCLYFHDHMKQFDSASIFHVKNEKIQNVGKRYRYALRQRPLFPKLDQALYSYAIKCFCRLTVLLGNMNTYPTCTLGYVQKSLVPIEFLLLTAPRIDYIRTRRNNKNNRFAPLPYAYLRCFCTAIFFPAKFTWTIL